MSPKNGRMRVTSATRPGFCNQWIGPIVILTVTLLSFGPILWNQFVEWDDYENLISNSHYRGLGWPQLSWMFTTLHMGPYQPLSWVTLGLDYLIWGMNPTGYHLTSLLFHAANAVFFYFISRRMLEIVWPGTLSQTPWKLSAGAAFGASTAKLTTRNMRRALPNRSRSCAVSSAAASKWSCTPVSPQ